MSEEAGVTIGSDGALSEGWTSSLPEDMRGNEAFAGVSNINDLATKFVSADPRTGENWHDGIEGVSDKDKESKSLSAYIKRTNYLQAQISAKGIIPPGEMATEDEKAAFTSQVKEIIGEDSFRAKAPETADGYEKPDWLGKDSAIGQERITGIFEDLHAAGKSQEDVDFWMDFYSKQSAADMDAHKASVAEAEKVAIKQLSEEWGADYKERIAGVESMEKKNPEFVAKLEAVGMARDIDVVKMFDAQFRATSEDSMVLSPEGRQQASDDYDAYTSSKEFLDVTSRNRKYSEGHPIYDAAMKKQRELLRRSMQGK